MSDYTGPGMYEIIPYNAQNMSLNVWGGATKAGTQVKLYERSPKAQNTQFEFVAAGGEKAKPENGAREYHIIGANTGLYLAMNDSGNITMELRPPLDLSIRWRISHAGNGAFYINSADTKKAVQLNVRGAGKTSGTELITYQYATAENVWFILKKAWEE